MAEDFAIGKALVIPQSVLNDITKLDDKINRIATDSENMASKFSTAITKMGGNVGELLAKLQNINNVINNIGNINAKGIDNVSSGLGKTNTEAEKVANSVTEAAVALNRFSKTWQELGGRPQVAKSFEILTNKEQLNLLKEARNEADAYSRSLSEANKKNQAETKASTNAIKEQMQAEKNRHDENMDRLKKEGSSIKIMSSSYRDYVSAITMSEQTETSRTKKIERMNTVLEELRKKESEYSVEIDVLTRKINSLTKENERLAASRQNSQKALEAQAKLESKLRRSNYQSYVTSTEGSLRTADKANTYAQRVQAIRNLEEAIKKLRTTDANYQKDLQRLSDAHKRLSAEQKKVESNFRTIQGTQSNLMNTSDQLARKLALIFSVSQIEGYVNKLVRVRGEFELQNTALASILQNKDKADKLFGQITDLAVQSPFTLKELVTYTKSLSAYSVEYEKLYDTTKMLADVSAGLGVDMQRLILAFGQVKAANFLRGCLGYDTPVMLFDGTIKKVQDISVGDVLINENGDAVNVLELIRGRETMYLIEQVSGKDRFSYRVNRNHILTLWNVPDQKLEDIYVYDYLKKKDYGYLGYKIIDGKEIFYDIEVTKDIIDDYYGFVLDGNKRFRLGDGTVTHNTETRQFTESGINMLGELAKYYTELEGRIVSVSEVQDRQFKKMISFQDVEQVFKRLTSEGGMFYEMQERQAETIAGQMSNLQDTIDIMLNDIGKANDSTIRSVIYTIKSIIENWEIFANAIKTSGVVFALYYSKIMLASVANGAFAKSAIAATAAQNGLVGATGKAITAIKALVASIKSNPFLVIASAVTMLGLELYDNAKKVEDNRKAYDVFTNSVKKTQAEFNNIAQRISGQNQKIKESSEVLSSVEAGTNEYADAESNANKERKKMNALLEELKTKFPEVYESIVQQKNGTVDLTEAQRLLNEELERTTYLSYLSKQTETFWSDGLVENIKDASDAQQQYKLNSEDLSNAYIQMNSRIKEYFATNKYASKDLQNQLDDISKSSISTSEKIEKMYSVVRNVSGVNIGDLRDIIYDYQDEARKARNANKDLENSNSSLSESIKQIANGYKLAFDTASEEGRNSAKAATEEFIRLLDIKNEAVREFVRSQFEITIGVKLDIENKKQPELSDIEKRINSYLDNMDFTLVPKIDAGEGTVKFFNELKEEYKSLTEEAEKIKRASQELYIDQTNVQRLEEINKKMSQVKTTLKDWGELEEEKTKKSKENSELKRLKEQISLIKKAGDEYEKLRKYYSEDEAKKRVVDAFSEAFAEVGVSIDMDFDVNGIIAAIENLSNRAGKAGSKAMKEAVAPLKAERDIKVQVKGVDEIQKQLDEVFAGYELSVELKNLGLDENIIGQLFNIDTFTLDDVKKNLDSVKPKLEQLGENGVDVFKKTEEKIADMQQKELEERLKKYADYLKKSVSERMSIEMEAQKKISEVQSTSQFTDTQKKDITDRIKKERDKELDSLSWKEFQESDMYIQLFEELEYVSTSAIISMKNKLAELKDSLKNLSPEQLKEINNQIKKLEDIEIQRNPFKFLFSDDIKEKSKAWQELGSTLNEVANAATDIASSLENVFGSMSDKTADAVESFSEIASGLGNTASGVGRIMAGDYIGGGIQALTGIVSTIGSIFNIGDKKKEREIQRQLELVDDLQRAYEKLEKAIDDAYSIDTYKEANDQAIANLKAQNASLQASIAAEQDKKKTDDDRIKEWQQQIEDNNEAIEELLKEQFSQVTGGILDDILSAANDFTDAWLESFKEVGDGMDGLEDNFQEMLTNMLKQQASMLITNTFLENWKKQLEKYINADDLELTTDEAKKWVDSVESSLPALNEALENYFKAMQDAGLDLSGEGGDTMTGLSKSISSITEDTAEVLASITESIRYFTSDSNTVLHNIYNLMINPPVENPFLSELKVQSEQLRLLYGLFNGIIKNVSGSGKAMSVRIV